MVRSTTSLSLPGATLLAIALAIPLLPGRARAGGFEVAEQSAVAAGTGGASTARPDDAAAAWYNPAALADGRGFRGSLNLLVGITSLSAEPLDGSATATDSVQDPSTPPSLHLSYADEDWAFGLYAGVSHGSAVAWPEGWWGRYEATLSRAQVLRMQPFFAYRLEQFRFSVGLHVDVGSLEVRRDLDMIESQGSSHLLLWGAGVGGDASVYWQATEELSLGLTYKSRTYIRMDGDADFEVADPFLARAPDQRVATDFWIPDRFALGAAFRMDGFGAYVDLGLSLWSVRDRQVFEFESELTDDVVQRMNWSEAISLRAGADFELLPDLLTVRGGAFYEMTPAPSSTLAPSSPDMDRVGFSVGLGVDPVAELGFDAYYSYMALLERESDGPDATPARYSGGAHLLAIGVRVAYDPSPETREQGAPEPMQGQEQESEREQAPERGQASPEAEAEDDGVIRLPTQYIDDDESSENSEIDE